jgi:hypothetical protein
MPRGYLEYATTLPSDFLQFIAHLSSCHRKLGTGIFNIEAVIKQPKEAITTEYKF